MILPIRRFAAETVTAEIWRYDGEPSREVRGDLVPDDVVCGNPWSRRSGGPEPAVRTWMTAPDVSIRCVWKPVNRSRVCAASACPVLKAETATAAVFRI
jgi:hypothetical protein